MAPVWDVPERGVPLCMGVSCARFFRPGGRGNERSWVKVEMEQPGASRVVLPEARLLSALLHGGAVMKTRQRIGMSLVLETIAYTSLTALHLSSGEAATLPYCLLVVAVSLRLRQRFRRNRKNRLNSSDRTTT